jgi:hypothetical protein
MIHMNYPLKKWPKGIKKQQWWQKEEMYPNTPKAQQRRMKVATVEGHSTYRHTRYMP